MCRRVISDYQLGRQGVKDAEYSHVAVVAAAVRPNGAIPPKPWSFHEAG